MIPNGIWTLDDLLCYGEQYKQCPYFTSRRIVDLFSIKLLRSCSLTINYQLQMQFCNIIIYLYHYLLDPKIAERVSNELSKDCIVVFDKAHNIDNVCIESLSTDITEDSLTRATRGVINLERRVNEIKETNCDNLEKEYRKLVEGLRDADESRQEDAFIANPGKLALSDTTLHCTDYIHSFTR